MGQHLAALALTDKQQTRTGSQATEPMLTWRPDAQSGLQTVGLQDLTRDEGSGLRVPGAPVRERERVPGKGRCPEVPLGTD